MLGSRLRVGVIGSSIWVDYFRTAFEADSDVEVIVLDRSSTDRMLEFRHIDVLYLVFGWLDLTHFPVFANCAARHVPIVVHWIGTDVWRMVNPTDLNKRMRIKRALLNRIMRGNRRCRHIAGAPWLVDELTMCGIEAEFYPVISGLLDSTLAPIYPLPAKTTAFTYIPSGREDFYGERLVLSAARNNPDISFIVVANKPSRQPLDLPNVEYHGWMKRDEMEQVLKSSTCCIRVTKHDGLGGTLMEAILRGRYGIFSYDHPHVYKATNEREMDSALASIRCKREPNHVGAKYVRNHYSLKVTRENLKRLLLLTGCSRSRS